MSEVLVNLVRGEIVESKHRGDLAVVDGHGRVIFSRGDPQAFTFWRSAAKPLQALPLVESGGLESFGLNDIELAVICASHSGEAEHTRVVTGILGKLGLPENSLMCGPAAPMRGSTAKEMLKNNQPYLAVHNPCSGKHLGMLALCLLKGWPLDRYYGIDHPVQQDILKVIAEVTAMKKEDIGIGIDGCGVPVYAMPLSNMAMAFSTLTGQAGGNNDDRTISLQRICSAMTTHPFYAAGTNRLDTVLMEVTGGRLVAKLGAESVYCVGLAGEGIGLCLKIEDGGHRALEPAVIKALKDLGWLREEEIEILLSKMHPSLKNHRGEVVGKLEPV